MNECYVYNAIILQNKELDTLTYEHIDEGWIGSCNTSNSYNSTKQKKIPVCRTKNNKKWLKSYVYNKI